MDLQKTGRFLSELRKSQGLTQEALGERLSVTNKTISRWETGAYLPPAEMLQQLSALFEVSINELLCGERVSRENYREKAEENLKIMVEHSAFSLPERIMFYKAKWRKEHIASFVLGGAAVAGAFAASWFCGPGWIVGAEVLTLGLYVHFYNRMMAYVERCAFDGSGR